MSPAFDTLSFITRNRPRGGGFNYWNVATTGSYSGDCLKGHELAAEYLAFVAAHPTYGNLSLLPSIVSSMMERAASAEGRTTRGIEIGFLGSINRAAIVGVTLIPSVATEAA